MKIDLSKYQQGTKFKLRNGATITLIGKSDAIDDRYILEYDDDGQIITRFGDGTHQADSNYDIDSVIQPDKYLVTFRRSDGVIDTEIVIEPKVLTPTSLMTDLRSKYALGALGMSIPEKILSWSKIKE